MGRETNNVPVHCCTHEYKFKNVLKCKIRTSIKGQGNGCNQHMLNCFYWIIMISHTKLLSSKPSVCHSKKETQHKIFKFKQCISNLEKNITITCMNAK